MDDRRSEYRRAIRLEVEYESLDEFLTDFASNMSLGGMFIQTDTPLSLGQTFALRFKLPGRLAAIEAEGEVRWVHDAGADDHIRTGMGVHFTGLSEADRVSIARWMQEWGD